MNRLLLALTCIVSLPGCSGSSGSSPPGRTTASSYTVLATGPNRQTAITNTPPLYHFKAAPGIRLDVREFYPVNYSAIPAPDMIQVVTPLGIYELVQASVTNDYVLDRTTLKELRGPAFPGFHSGDQGALQIGHTMPDKGSTAFHVWWVGKFAVD